MGKTHAFFIGIPRRIGGETSRIIGFRRLMYGLVYVLKNTINNKRYIGQTTMKLQKRIQKHFAAAKEGRTKMPLFDAIRKYGKDAFIIEQTIECLDRESLDKTEIRLIDELNTIKNGYNIRVGGEGWGVNDRKHMSEKMKKIYADPIKRQALSKRTSKQMNTAARQHLSNKASEQWANNREMMTEAIKKKMADEQVNQKMRKAQQVAFSDPARMAKHLQMCQTPWTDERRSRASKIQKERAALLPVEEKRRLADYYANNKEKVDGRIRESARKSMKERYGERKVQITGKETGVIFMYDLSDYCKTRGIVAGNATKVIRGEIKSTQGYVFKELIDKPYENNQN